MSLALKLNQNLEIAIMLPLNKVVKIIIMNLVKMKKFKILPLRESAIVALMTPN